MNIFIIIIYIIVIYFSINNNNYKIKFIAIFREIIKINEVPRKIKINYVPFQNILIYGLKIIFIIFLIYL